MAAIDEGDSLGRKTERRGGGFAKAWLAWGLMLAASLANFLHFHGYQLLTGEVAMLAGGLALLGAALAGVQATTGRVGGAILTGLLLFVAIDLNADQLGVAGALGLVAAAAAWARPGETLRFLTLAFAVVLATGLAGLGGTDPAITERATKKAAPAAGARPLVVEIILDEQVGPAGLAAADARWLEARYQGMGFRVYRQAYSRHYHTTNALAELVRGEPSPGARAGARTGGLAARLKQFGYRSVEVVQTRHFELCGPLGARRCTTVSHASLAAIASQRWSAADKARVLAYHFAGLSTIARKIANGYDRRIGEPRGHSIELRAARKVPQVNALAAVGRVEAQLSRARPGEFHLIHLLLPHAPFSYAADCRLKRPREWRIERSVDALAERDAAYGAQMRCAAVQVERLVMAALASPGGRGAVILVHGDHGSRIVAHEPFGDEAARASDDDLARGFATLFAVRMPGQPGGSVTGQAALPVLVDALAASGFTKLPAAGEAAPWVYLDDEQWRPAASRALPVWKAPQSDGRGQANQQDS